MVIIFYQSENISIRKVNKILTVGRIVQQKNFSFLISEFSNTKEKFSIDIVGEGPQKETLEKLALQRNVQINFLGRVNHSELLSLYKEYKFFISTSYYEGNPKTLLEAMAAGCVVFASDISNHRELITNSNDGFLFQFDKGSLMSIFNDYSNKDYTDYKKAHTETTLIDPNSINYREYSSVDDLEKERSKKMFITHEELEQIKMNDLLEKQREGERQQRLQNRDELHFNQFEKVNQIFLRN